MSPKPYSAALPVARVFLRFLVVLNLLSAVAILVLLIFMPTEQWILSSFDLKPSAEADRIIRALHAIAVVGLVTVPLNHLLLRRLLAMVDSVRAGDPFVSANASRLQAIAWVLLALQLLSIVVAAIAKYASTPEHPLRFDAGFSISGWLAVLLMFVLARVFAEGALMREDLARTV